MDLQLTEEQKLVRDSAARFVADMSKKGGVGAAFDRGLWADMAELGWIAAGIPEELGGLGGAIETSLIAEQIGRGSVGSWFLGTAVLGPQLLVAAGDTLERNELLPEVIAGTTKVAAAFSETSARGNLASVRTRAIRGDQGYLLSGSKTLVLGGDIADMLIVSARVNGEDTSPDGIELFLVDPAAEGVRLVPTPLVDGANAVTIKLDVAKARALGSTDAFAALTAMSEHGIACMAAESVGMIEAVGDITAEYLRNRRQFGVPLGEFQVMQHKLANMAIDAEMTRAALLVVLAAFQLNDPILRRQRFSGAKAFIGESLRRVTGSGVQAHGGMGMTQEYPIGRYLQKMISMDAILGNPSDHRLICSSLLSRSALA
jgi:alkylation response protein AidB-like acyl-CoA dehydrogenase